MKFSLLILFAFPALTFGAPTNLTVGDYWGTDDSGQACEVFLGAGMGETVMDHLMFETSDVLFDVFTGGSPDTTSPGKVDSKDVLMYDGYEESRPYYHSFDGAPIGAELINLGWSLSVKGNYATDIEASVSPFEMSDTPDYACRNMKYTGPYRKFM